MKKKVWFFCQLLIAGGVLWHTTDLTPTEARRYLQDLRNQEQTRQAYAIEIGDVI